jgi:ABC-2 type transport system ATP-binding protein
MHKLGKKQLAIELRDPMTAIPAALSNFPLTLSPDGKTLTYDYDTKGERTGITTLLDELRAVDIRFRDLQTRQTSLEDIFVNLVKQGS